MTSPAGPLAVAPDFAALRAAMVEGQLRPNRVVEPEILAPFKALLREDFAAEGARAHAYDDTPLPLPTPGRFAMAPLVAGHMLKALGAHARGRVLVVGAGTGYESLLLATMAESVVALEDDVTLAAIATHQAVVHHAQNVTVATGPLLGGYAAAAPYDAIVMVAPFAVDVAPLKAQLKEGGLLVGLRAGQGAGLGRLVAGVRHGKTFVEETLMETEAVAHPALREEERFVF